MPLRLLPLLHPHETVHAASVGWAAFKNGERLRGTREAGYAAIVTCDRNIRHQQNLAAAAASTPSATHA